MIIQTNINALNVARNLRNTGNIQTKSSQRLSSGLRINSAADDPAGLAISEQIQGQIRGLNQADHNANDAISLVDVAEGSMAAINDMVIRIRELTVLASNDTNTHTAGSLAQSDRTKIQTEIDLLIAEIDSVAKRTNFNTRVLLDGSWSRIAKFDIEEDITPIRDLTNTWGATPLLNGLEQNFDFPNLPEYASTSIKLVDIDMNGDSSQLIGKSFQIGSVFNPNSIVRFNFDEAAGSLYFTEGNRIPLPAKGTQTVAEFFSGLATNANFLAGLNSVYGNNRSVISDISVNTATGEVIFTGGARNMTENIDANGLTFPYTSPNADANFMNAYSIFSDEGEHLRKVDGSFGANNVSGIIDFSKPASGSVTLRMFDNYTREDIDSLIESMIRVRLPTNPASSYDIEFSRDGADGSIKVSDGMTGAELEDLIKARLESIGFITSDPARTTTARGYEFELNVAISVAPNTWNAPLDISSYDVETVDVPYQPPTDAVPKKYTETKFTATTMQGIIERNIPTPPDVPSIREIELPSTIIVPCAIKVNYTTITIYDSTSAIGDSYFDDSIRDPDPGKNYYAYDVRGKTDAELQAWFKDRVISLIRGEDIGNNTIRIQGDPSFSSPTISAATTEVILQEVTEPAQPAKAEVPAHTKKVFTEVSSNDIMDSSPQLIDRPISFKMNLAADGLGNINFSDTDGLIGTGFTFMEQLFEFSSGSPLNQNATQINVSASMSPDDVANAIQNAMSARFAALGGTSSATMQRYADIASSIKITAGAGGEMNFDFNVRTRIERPVPPDPKLINGNLQYDGLFSNSSTGFVHSAFSGGTIADRPRTVVDFSSVGDLVQLLGTGFRISCASCPHEFVNIIFVDQDNGKVPDGFYLPPPDDSTYIRNLAVNISDMNYDPAKIVSSMVDQLEKRMDHLTQVRVDPSNPYALIIEDKRRGDLSGATAEGANRGLLTSGVYTNFIYKVHTDIHVPDGLWFQTGANSLQGVTLNIEPMDARALGLRDRTKSIINVMHESGADISSHITTLDVALAHINNERAKLGAMHNRLEFTSKSLSVSSDNLSAAASRIKDADMAKEMMHFMRGNVLQQAAVSMLAQANNSAQSVLHLLR